MSGESSQVKPTKIKVTKETVGNLDDKKIPRELIIKYGDTHYILKAGLEWKATKLFGLGGYSIILKMLDDPAKHDPNKLLVARVLFKATLTILETGAKFVNFGEASTKNVNKMMVKQMLHLAATRAECRVLRMATACGYASFDEVKTTEENGDVNTNTTVEGGDKPPTKAQLATIKTMGGKKVIKTKQQAVDYIKELAVKKSKKKGK